MLTIGFFKKSRKKVLQENRKWTFLKCPKWKISEYFFKEVFKEVKLFYPSKKSNIYFIFYIGFAV